MFNPKQINEMLKNVEEGLRMGVFMPARQVDYYTFICFTEILLKGMGYHQGQFDQLPKHLQDGFKGKVKGERVGQYKIVAVYDIWTPADIPMVTKVWNS